jgi:predicted phage-related endonuclease
MHQNLAVPVTHNHTSALRLVSTKDMSREDWLAVRKQGIGASDAAAAVGLEPVPVTAGIVDDQDRS